MELEWDETKRQWTLENRQLDFADVAFIDRASLVSEQDTRQDYGEVRFSSFAYLRGRLINFCWTPRAGGMRIFSMRKANDRERKKYQTR
ncbi:MAG: hypothetical protein BGO82_10165 [Devosia sp. 67-54]|uniref:BrnT family toxin n=1 Tax=unclassified Devosia TaxID=196773 RepID=UPI00095FEA8F|nr:MULTISPECIES: BrnT family toxin [unclassified Devosia]MBN9304999.1 BrnT family toxin [Devosia sp.]OJX15056.1 MAG: hypothetical protein BGO82_10165 [Devosia sp. 67-54]